MRCATQTSEKPTGEFSSVDGAAKSSEEQSSRRTDPSPTQVQHTQVPQYQDD